MKVNALSRALALSIALTSAVSSGASAATLLTWGSYKQSELSDAQTDRANLETDTQVALETFESYTAVADGGAPPGDTTPLLNTSVGDFTTIAGSKCGGSCDTPENESLIRSVSGFGRYNTTLGGTNWLDSNDNAAIVLKTTKLSAFDSVSFFLTDIDDVGAVTFNIEAVTGDVTESFDIASDIFGGKKRKDGDLFFVRLEFMTTLNDLELTLNIDDGDGFGLDDVRYGLSAPAPVPVPASLPLLAAGFGALGWYGRRRKAPRS